MNLYESYALRIQDHSDVQVYRTSPSTIRCIWGAESYEARSETEMIEHLLSHRRRGHRVPQEALERLWAEHWGAGAEAVREAALARLEDRA